MFYILTYGSSTEGVKDTEKKKKKKKKKKKIRNPRVLQ
jgi:hypothetical protein